MRIGMVGLGRMGANMARRLKDDIRRAAILRQRGIRYIDAGASGGVGGSKAWN